MDPLVILWSVRATRPPALDPRRRRIDRAVEQQLRVCIRSALHVPANTPVTLTEWVALDSRAVPHTVCVGVGTGRARRHFVIERPSERIVETDVHAALQCLPQQLCVRGDGRDDYER